MPKLNLVPYQEDYNATKLYTKDGKELSENEVQTARDSGTLKDYYVHIDNPEVAQSKGLLPKFDTVTLKTGVAEPIPKEADPKNIAKQGKENLSLGDDLSTAVTNAKNSRVDEVKASEKNSVQDLEKNYEEYLKGINAEREKTNRIYTNLYDVYKSGQLGAVPTLDEKEKLKELKKEIKTKKKEFKSLEKEFDEYTKSDKQDGLYQEKKDAFEKAKIELDELEKEFKIMNEPFKESKRKYANLILQRIGHTLGEMGNYAQHRANFTPYSTQMQTPSQEILGTNVTQALQKYHQREQTAFDEKINSLKAGVGEKERIRTQVREIMQDPKLSPALRKLENEGQLKGFYSLLNVVNNKIGNVKISDLGKLMYLSSMLNNNNRLDKTIEDITKSNAGTMKEVLSVINTGIDTIQNATTGFIGSALGAK